MNGGDGTLQHTLTEILEHGGFEGRVPRIAMLRGGRTNMTALDIGSHRDPLRGMAALIEAVRNGTLEERIQPRHVLRVVPGYGRSAQHGMFFGAGVIYRAIEFIHDKFPPGQARGVFGSTVVTGGLLGRVLLGHNQGIVASDKVQLMVDDEVTGGEYLLTIASSCHRLFARMRPFWGEGPGGVRLTTVHGSAQHAWKAAPGILAGRPGPVVTPENGYDSRNAKRVEMKFDCGFTIDGEQFAPENGRTLSITADRVVDFVRA